MNLSKLFSNIIDYKLILIQKNHDASPVFPNFVDKYASGQRTQHRSPFLLGLAEIYAMFFH